MNIFDLLKLFLAVNTQKQFSFHPRKEYRQAKKKLFKSQRKHKDQYQARVCNWWFYFLSIKRKAFRFSAFSGFDSNEFFHGI